MGRDFTFEIYKELLKQIPAGNYTVKDALTNKNQLGIIRHDVDRPPKNVIDLAKLENELNIKSTYYFRVKKKHFNPEVMSRVKELGHEIGYHYEVLDKANGNIDAAIKIFKEEWELFRKWESVTICMHGNPFSKYLNRDIWKDNNFSNYNVLGEGYLSIDFAKYIYFTDTSRKWNFQSYSIKDKVDRDLLEIKSTKDLIKKIKAKEITNFYILTHPSRWNDDWVPWTVEITLQTVKNVIKYYLNIFRKSNNKSS
jgi:hypothetical protein